MIDRKKIGAGQTATVYEWEDGRVLKLFVPGYPEEAAEREYRNASALSGMGFAKPKAFDMVSWNGRRGIVYERVDGEALDAWVLRTGDLPRCAEWMAGLHRDILSNAAGDAPSCKAFLRDNLGRLPAEAAEMREEALRLLDTLEDGDALCHGDFHPGNILLSEGRPTAIDFMNICRGPRAYDVARTVFLVEYTPVPADAPDREQLLRYKKELAGLYLREMGMTREAIAGYLSVIRTSRRGECPDEKPAEWA